MVNDSFASITKYQIYNIRYTECDYVLNSIIEELEPDAFPVELGHPPPFPCPRLPPPPPPRFWWQEQDEQRAAFEQKEQQFNRELAESAEELRALMDAVRVAKEAAGERSAAAPRFDGALLPLCLAGHAPAPAAACRCTGKTEERQKDTAREMPAKT